MALDARMAEAYAIEAVCSGVRLAGRSRGRRADCARSKVAAHGAGSLEPQNPRDQLIEALCRPSEKQRRLRPNAGAPWSRFEAAPPSRPGNPDWGHAEALALLGKSYLQRGEPVAARDALERALVMAPDYREAQELLQDGRTRPR